MKKEISIGIIVVALVIVLGVLSYFFFGNQEIGSSGTAEFTIKNI